MCVGSDSLQESAPEVEGGSEGDGLRRRNVSLLGSLDRRGKGGELEEEEEEEEGEEYRPPPAREEETGLSLNKCILGAVLLLGLGTIFFSGECRDVLVLCRSSCCRRLSFPSKLRPATHQLCCLCHVKCLSSVILSQICCFSLK